MASYSLLQAVGAYLGLRRSSKDPAEGVCVRSGICLQIHRKSQLMVHVRWHFGQARNIGRSPLWRPSAHEPSAALSCKRLMQLSKQSRFGVHPLRIFIEAAVLQAHCHSRSGSA